MKAIWQGASRIWVMDRGIPTERVLAEMRQSDPPLYLVGTPKGRLSKLEAELIAAHGSRFVRDWTSSCWPMKANFTCRLKAKTASAKSEPCAGADCENSGTGSVNSRK